MKKSLKIFLLALAAVLLVSGSAVLFLISKSDDASKESSKETQIETLQYLYDENGEVKSEVYYTKDGKYNGQKDFFTEKSGKKHVMTYNKDGEIVKTETTTYTESGKISVHKIIENKELIFYEEYIYDKETDVPVKYLKKEIDENGDELSEKIMYDSDGKTVKLKSTYKNGELLTEEEYPKNK